MTDNNTAKGSELSMVMAVRHLSEEARVVLTSLRGGPPHIARGDLAQDLIDLRQQIAHLVVTSTEETTAATGTGGNSNTTSTKDGTVTAASASAATATTSTAAVPYNEAASASAAVAVLASSPPTATTMQPPEIPDEQQEQQELAVVESSVTTTTTAAAATPSPSLPASTPGAHDFTTSSSSVQQQEQAIVSLNPYTRPFLQVIMDPRASGPHTLVTLRSLYRLLQHGTIVNKYFNVTHQELCVSVLACKFEQTDAGADEAVEMAIADVLCLLIRQTDDSDRQKLHADTFLDAFNTVFVTRNTFVHSPALCYHFEDVLSSMVTAVFFHGAVRNQDSQQESQTALLEFLVNQLLHTPLVGGGGDIGGGGGVVSSTLDESTREAQIAHDDTRMICLRLIVRALQTLERDKSGRVSGDNNPDAADDDDDDDIAVRNPQLLNIIQDDLCLSLLMTGQAIWAYHDATTNISPGFISLPVLAQICSTFSLLWNTTSLRCHLIAQFETIFTGFYTRALVLLRKRKQPMTSSSFNANLVFDAEVEIILESLVDLLCLHDHDNSIAEGNGGTLETLFSYYDCHLRRSDVATGLCLELSRCCGGTVNADGEAVVLLTTPTMSRTASEVDGGSGGGNGIVASSGGGGSGEAHGSVGDLQDSPNSHNGSILQQPNSLGASAVHVEHPWRPVPAHLKELCAQALMGGMKCLFRDDKPSEKTLAERSKRKRSILLRQLEFDEQNNLMEPSSSSAGGGESLHYLRDLKSKKRLLSKAARIFNTKASRGIEFLLDSGLVPDPITPQSMAVFLRNGIVVGLDKKAVGAYLGEAGKSPIAGKSPSVWERDWFHKDVLKIYCSLFRFEGQSLLDSLRMFLATFRLPGEAQQIDRILQAFSDSCSQVCEESSGGRSKLFSDDPKRASDAAYLLSFSIIMLNTDRHNANIREDRKMSCEDFVKNNADYGRDITDKGKEFPPEYLEGIYESINEEEIRTEGEGAEGAMTVERWKDVLRGSTMDDEDVVDMLPSSNDAEDLTELVLEHVWKPIVSAIGALWGVTAASAPYIETPQSTENARGNMLGVQGARLGMDMSLEMLNGVCQLGRIDVFRRILNCICDYGGLLGEYVNDAEERCWQFTNSLESQAAVVVAVRTAISSGEYLDEDSWKRVWSMLFELRDLQLLSHGKASTHGGILHESDADLLNERARKDWNYCLRKGDMAYLSRLEQEKDKEKSAGLLSAFGRALFGGQADEELDVRQDYVENVAIEPSAHGKENLVVWDEGADSDGEGDEDFGTEEGDPTSETEAVFTGQSAGSMFESILIRESLERKRQVDMPVTGLERIDDSRQLQLSARTRVRDRLRNASDLESLITESRFMDESTIECMLRALVDLVQMVLTGSPYVYDIGSPPPSAPLPFERSPSDVSMSTASITAATGPWHIPISPASEAFAEVLIAEIALKNKDRLDSLWKEVLQNHYLSCLTSFLVNPSEAFTSSKIPVNPGLEKRVTGLLRLSICAVRREDTANDVLSAWKYLLPVNDEQHASSPLKTLDRHIGEGLWRIVSQIESLTNLNEDGWEGVVSLLSWCAKRGGDLKPLSPHGPSGLLEDDPALQCYRSLHLLMNSKEVDGKIPISIVLSLRCLIAAGGRRRYAQLSIASLDLLDIFHGKMMQAVVKRASSSQPEVPIPDAFWTTSWRKIVEGIAEAAELSNDTNIRQHALSMLTDLFLQKQGGVIPPEQLCGVLSEVCVPLAGRRILRLQIRDPSVETTDQLMMEFELCISLIFKPLRHHLKNFVDCGASLPSIWQSVLSVIEALVVGDGQSPPMDESRDVIPEKLKETMNSLANEHLQNAIKVLLTTGVLSLDDATPGDITAMTWESVSRMGVSDGDVLKLKEEAVAQKNAPRCETPTAEQ